MKKMLLSIAIAALAISSVKAQDDPHVDSRMSFNRIRFGAYVAPNISWMHPTSSKNDDGTYNVNSDGSKVGFTYGLMGEYYFARNYALVSGLQVNGTGGKIIATADQSRITTAGDQVRKADFNYRLQFLEIPIALKLKTDDISGFRFFGQLGATLGFNIGKKVNYTVDYYDYDAGAVETVSGDKIKLSGSIGSIAPVMLQMNIGAGAEYPISNKLTAYLGLFFNNGFTPDATAPNKFDNGKLGYKGSFKDGNTRLNNFALRVGLFF